MIAHISQGGMLIIEPESELESYALTMWANQNRKEIANADILISKEIIEKKTINTETK
jgi:hypothetical protein